MKISPACELTQFSSLSPGNLVRILGNYDGDWGIISGVKDAPQSRAIIHLSGENFPTFTILDSSTDLSVLVLASKPVLEIDHTGPFEPPFHGMSSANGCIIRNSSGWFLNVRSSTSRIYRSHYDLENHMLVDSPTNHPGFVVFGKWAIFMESAGLPSDERLTVSTFSYSSSEHPQ